MSLTFLRDRAFLREILTIAIPISFQQLVNASLNMIDVIMVGQLGEATIAALGLANQVFFVFILLLFGTTSGMAIFTAQFWGKQEVGPIRKVLGMSILTTSVIALIFTLAAALMPKTVLGFYTNDPEVIKLGSRYLCIIGFSYIPVAIATSYIATLRSIQLIKITVISTISALIFKTALGYMLIFGIRIFPALGVAGAAIGTASGWILELILLLVLIYAQKTPLAANPLTFFSFKISFFGQVFRTTFPALANEFFWSVGITTYNAIYAHIGTDAIAAIYETVRRVVILCVFGAWVVGLIVFLLRDLVVGLYDLSPSGVNNVRMLILMMACTLWIRMFNFSTFIGALRAGGTHALLLSWKSVPSG